MFSFSFPFCGVFPLDIFGYLCYYISTVSRESKLTVFIVFSVCSRLALEEWPTIFYLLRSSSEDISDSITYSSENLLKYFNSSTSASNFAYTAFSVCFTAISQSVISTFLTSFLKRSFPLSHYIYYSVLALVFQVVNCTNLC